MTDKQREDHVQAKYWNGFITRVEAQKVFDELAGVIAAQAQTLQKYDVAFSCLAEKVGLTAAEVNDWLQKKTAEKIASSPDVICDDAQPTPSSVITAN